MNPDMPTPSAEEELKFLSVEEVEAQMAKFKNGPEVPGSKRGWGNPPEYSEVVTSDETGTNFFLISYQADVKKTGDAIIRVIHWQKGPDGSKEWVRGSVRAQYNGATGQWSDTDIDFAPFPFVKTSSTQDMSRTEVAETPIVTQNTAETPLVVKPEANETEITKEKFEGLLKEANVQSVYTLFDIARAQGERCQKTLEMIYTQLLVLNISNSSASKQYRLDTWDPNGKLTEAQFTAFTTQFRELSGIAGAEITKESIKNGVTEIREDIPAQERVHDVIELFDTAEALLETTDIPTLEARERENMGLALTKRAAAKAFADRVTTELIKLNRSFGPPATFDDWNPTADLTEDQFNELKRRRKILANAVGSLNALKIRHDLNEV